MSPEHESSYYEIALTNRQVLTIFIVLLTCLVAAFLSGVWIGRRDGGEGPLEAAVSQPAEPAAAELTELNFFSDPPSKRRPQGGAQRPARKAEPAAEEPAPARPQPPPVAEESKTPPRPAAAPAPAPSTPAAPTPAAPTPAAPTPAPAAAAGRVIQVFSTPDAAQADKLVRRLGEGGYPAYLVEESLAGGKTYRVRVGPYQQEAKAKQIADELRREYRLDTWITSQPG